MLLKAKSITCQKYDNGTTPDIAINDRGTVIEVHHAGNSTTQAQLNETRKPSVLERALSMIKANIHPSH